MDFRDLFKYDEEFQQVLACWNNEARSVGGEPYPLTTKLNDDDPITPMEVKAMRYAFIQGRVQPFIEYHEEPVRLHSGGKSHWLVRGDHIFANERLRQEVLRWWGYYVMGFRKPYFFWAIPTGGSQWAEAIAEYAGGSWANRPGPVNIRNGSTIFTVDDVLTTGASLGGGQHPLVVVDRRGRVESLPRVCSWATIYLPVED